MVPRKVKDQAEVNDLEEVISLAEVNDPEEGIGLEERDIN